MRRIRIFEHISLDGFISPGGRHENTAFADGGWTAPYRTPAGAAALAEKYGTNYDLLLGRRTYDQWSKVWPTMKGGPFADGINGATKYVATHRPESLQWGPIGLLGEDAIGGIRKLKDDGDRDLIVCGSTSLTSVLLENGLVEEVVLIVYPVLLGEGKRFFWENVEPRELAFAGSLSTPSGVLLNTYAVVGPLETASKP